MTKFKELPLPDDINKTPFHLAAEWHPTKNGNLPPDDISKWSKRKIWWQCSKDEQHIWEATSSDRNSGKGCPFCSGRRVTHSNSLGSLNPELASEWHPTKNGELSPYDVSTGSGLKVWWKCFKGDDHEWQATITSRSSGNGCKYCSGKKAASSQSLAVLFPSITQEWHKTKNDKWTPYDVGPDSRRQIWWICKRNETHEWQASPYSRVNSYKEKAPDCPICTSLSSKYPNLALEWHPTKNGSLIPSDVTTGSNVSVYWKCSEGEDHVWVQSVKSRVMALKKNKTNESNCQVCSKLIAVPSNCLSTTHQHIAKEWDHEKNNVLGVPITSVTSISRKKVFWICSRNPKHRWDAVIRDRISGGRKKLGSGCPYCSNKKVSEEASLYFTHPELTREWHPTKNGDLIPQKVTLGSDLKVWWKCSVGNDHEWEATISSRVAGRSCPICINRKTVSSNCLAKTHPHLTSQWHPSKNGNLTPYDITASYSKKIWWKCIVENDHEWDAVVSSRSRNDYGCPCCSGIKAVPSNCLANLKPELVSEWHPDKNEPLTPYDVTPGSSQKVFWVCEKNLEHIWESVISDRSQGHGCPYCNLGWTLGNIRLFVRSLLPHLENFTPAELYVIFQQHGILKLQAKGKSFIQALKTGKFPKDELEKFVEGQKSLVDEFISDPEKRLEDHNDELIESSKCLKEEDLLQDDQLPMIETKDVLALLENKLTANIDKEAIDFFVDSATAKIWRHVFLDENEALKQLEAYSNTGTYSKEVKRKFLEQYHGALNLPIPFGYNFKLNGKIHLPNLMQRFTAFMIQKLKRFGNWSGTGAGKTLSAILSSRVIDAKLSIICCPNSVVKGWKDNIEAIFPDSVVLTKELTITPSSHNHQYIILNYEFFQQPNSENKLKQLLNTIKVDLVVIDEIHYSKQRIVEDISIRKKVISAMLAEAAGLNENLHVLGMSATPVINNLFEGKTLIELITGLHHDELNTNPSVGNCIALYQKFVSNGLRWLPQYKQHLNINTIEVDCSQFIEEIKNISLSGSMVDLESILTKAKIPEILKHLKPKTIVYTHYIKNILPCLEDAIKSEGWKTAVYSGENKSGLEEFLIGDAEVLIATSCIGTGVDGLQNVSDRIIISTLPWTNAEFEQLKGRVYRQGQKSDRVDIVIPLTHAFIGSERWSWCDSRWKRIQFKKSLADAAVDGVIPEGHLRTPSQAYQDVMKWLARLENGSVHEIERRKIDMCLSDQQQKVAFRKFGDFSKMNHRLNSSSSPVTHQRLLQNPEEWQYYHSLYRDARKDWSIVPYKEAVKWCKARPHLIIGDFGCGEALLANEIENKIYSFDHIAINEDVIPCDITHVPIDDESLDAAIFSLSLMGTNYLDYIKEAHRCLKLDGHLWIAEATSRYQNLHGFEEELSKIGFDLVPKQEKGNFTFLRAIKSDRYSH